MADARDLMDEWEKRTYTPAYVLNTVLSAMEKLNQDERARLVNCVIEFFALAPINDKEQVDAGKDERKD